MTNSPSDIHLLKKGEYTRPGPVVPPGVLSMISSLDKPFSGPPPGAKTTHRRLKLAKWITDPRHPLSARVYVNRLWQHHFGRGLVSSANNFGFNGNKPSHPELLDWLADEFVRGGWTSKKIHFLMMTSRAYQQSSVHPSQESFATRDPDNQFLWRGTRRRQDAEALRDAILAASGRLDVRIGGPSFKPTISQEALEGLSQKGRDFVPSPAKEQGRRSLYLYSRRGLVAPLLTTFDFCDTTQPCGLRDVSVVAPQALALMNGASRMSRVRAWRSESPRLRGRTARLAPVRPGGSCWLEIPARRSSTRRRGTSNASASSFAVTPGPTIWPSRHSVTF